jgi:hypothetical protein
MHGIVAALGQQARDQAADLTCTNDLHGMHRFNSLTPHYNVPAEKENP